MYEQRLTIFTDMCENVQKDGVGVEQVRPYVLLFEWSSIKEPRIADCFRSYLHLVRRIFFSFCNLDELLILSKFERIDEPIFALKLSGNPYRNHSIDLLCKSIDGFLYGFSDDFRGNIG